MRNASVRYEPAYPSTLLPIREGLIAPFKHLLSGCQEVTFVTNKGDKVSCKPVFCGSRWLEVGTLLVRHNVVWPLVTIDSCQNFLLCCRSVTCWIRTLLRWYLVSDQGIESTGILRIQFLGLRIPWITFLGAGQQLWYQRIQALGFHDMILTTA